MPGGGRRIPRNSRPQNIVTQGPPGPTILAGPTTQDINNMKYTAIGTGSLPTIDLPPAPKHLPYPNTPVDSDLFFEILMFIFTTVAAGLQFLQIYRSVWWLPHAYTHHAVVSFSLFDLSLLHCYEIRTCEFKIAFCFQNFYLIDTHLVMFILIIFARRLIYMLGCVILEKFTPTRFHTIVFKIYRYYIIVINYILLLILCDSFISELYYYLPFLEN